MSKFCAMKVDVYHIILKHIFIAKSCINNFYAVDGICISVIVLKNFNLLMNCYWV